MKNIWIILLLSASLVSCKKEETVTYHIVNGTSVDITITRPDGSHSGVVALEAGESYTYYVTALDGYLPVPYPGVNEVVILYNQGKNRTVLRRDDEDKTHSVFNYDSARYSMTRGEDTNPDGKLGPLEITYTINAVMYANSEVVAN